MQKLKEIVLKIIIFFHCKLINFNLKNINKKKIYYYTNSIFGLGDTLQYCLLNLKKINKNKNFFLALTTYQLIVARFFFNEKQIIKIPLLIPGEISHYYQKYFKNNSYLKTKKKANEKILYSLKNNDYIYKTIINKLKKKKISKKIYFLKKKNYISLFIKHYDTNKNNFQGSASRQTSDLNKVANLINYLNKKKIHVLIFGKKKEKSIINLQKIITKKFNYFFYELSNKYSFNDQVYAAKHSIGYVGNGSFIPVLFYFLKKKTLIFDHHYQNIICPNTHKKYKKFLYKSYKKNNYFKILSVNDIEKNLNRELDIKEVSLIKIISNLNRFILNK